MKAAHSSPTKRFWRAVFLLRQRKPQGPQSNGATDNLVRSRAILEVLWPQSIDFYVFVIIFEAYLFYILYKRFFNHNINLAIPR